MTMMMMQATKSRLLTAVVAALWLALSAAYPMIAEVPEAEQKCFRFNIPKDDDAHMVFTAVPSTLPQEIEEWYVDQTVSLTRQRADFDGALQRKFPKQPNEELLKQLDQFLEDNGRKSGVQLKVQKPRNPRPMRQQEITWFIPIVINHVEKFQRRTTEYQADSQLDGYSVCFENTSDTQVHVIFDIVLVSEDLGEDDDVTTDMSFSKKHLTPLEQELAASINAANSILSEMRYMENRESRMRLTTDSINRRIRLFSYISVFVLLAVTYLQVTYLKRYFKKKKLM